MRWQITLRTPYAADSTWRIGRLFRSLALKNRARMPHGMRRLLFENPPTIISDPGEGDDG